MTKSKQTVSRRRAKQALSYATSAPDTSPGIAPRASIDAIAEIALKAPSAGSGDAPTSSANAIYPSPGVSDKTSKLERLVTLLQRPEGACLAELCDATGWQVHSVRGALAGTLKHKGHVFTSGKVDGIRRYRIVVPT